MCCSGCSACSFLVWMLCKISHVIYKTFFSSKYVIAEGHYTQFISSLWNGYPEHHGLMPWHMKIFYILNIAYWVHVYPELYLQKVKKVNMIVSTLIYCCCSIHLHGYRPLCNVAIWLVILGGYACKNTICYSLPASYIGWIFHEVKSLKSYKLLIKILFVLS